MSEAAATAVDRYSQVVTRAVDTGLIRQKDATSLLERLNAGTVTDADYRMAVKKYEKNSSLLRDVGEYMGLLKRNDKKAAKQSAASALMDVVKERFQEVNGRAPEAMTETEKKILNYAKSVIESTVDRHAVELVLNPCAAVAQRAQIMGIDLRNVATAVRDLADEKKVPGPRLDGVKSDLARLVGIAPDQAFKVSQTADPTVHFQFQAGDQTVHAYYDFQSDRMAVTRDPQGSYQYAELPEALAQLSAEGVSTHAKQVAAKRDIYNALRNWHDKSAASDQDVERVRAALKELDIQWKADTGSFIMMPGEASFAPVRRGSPAAVTEDGWVHYKFGEPKGGFVKIPLFGFIDAITPDKTYHVKFNLFADPITVVNA